MASLTGALLLVGSPFSNADVRYATGFTAPDPVVFLQHGRRRELVVSLLEVERARRTTTGLRVWAPEELGADREARRTLAGWTLTLLRYTRVRRVIVPPDFSVALAQKLVRAGIRVAVAKGAIFPRRAVKSARELRRIAETQRAAVHALGAALRTLRRARVDRRGGLRLGGRRLTADALRATINKTLLDYNCVGQGTIVACGRQAADPHAAGTGPLRAHAPIVLDIFPQHLRHGYWGDLTRTVVKGRAPPRVRRLYAAVKAAQAAALAQVRAGVGVARVHRAAADTLRRHGYRTGVMHGKTQGFIHSTGHGVGLEIHEAPGIGARPARLRAGHVVTIEPGLYYRAIGGLRLEDLIVVTPTGWRYLAPCAHRLEV